MDDLLAGLKRRFEVLPMAAYGRRVNQRDLPGPCAGCRNGSRGLSASSTRRRVLVLDGDTRQALSVVRALGEAGLDAEIGATSQQPLAGYSRYS